MAAKITAGVVDMGIGCGVESMSLYDMNSIVSEKTVAKEVLKNEQARYCLLPMGETSENVAERFGVNRHRQDTMAVESHRKAWKAQQEGLFKGNLLQAFR
jgi:acetyl-CoA acyltransferase 1